MKHYNIIIIGAGIAGLSAIKSIREEDQQSSILLISDEDRLPYKRTKINKLLDVGFNKDDFKIHAQEYYYINHIDLSYEEITQLIPEQKTIHGIHNSYIYNKLLIATGKKPKSLPFKKIPTDKIFHIYKASDAENLIHAANNLNHFLIIGGGVEGLEMADQLIKMKKRVTLVNKSNHLMHKHLTKSTSKILENRLKENGIDIIVDSDIENKLTYNNDAIYYNKTNAFDAIVTCIGAVPNCDFITDSSILIKNGIQVNWQLQTFEESIYAAGDVAILPDESGSYLWHEAEAQGYHVGTIILGHKSNYKNKPFRLKSNIMGMFLFSQNKPDNIDDYYIIIEENDTLYRELFVKDDRITGIIMINDKSRSKTYEKAVWEQWSIGQLHKELPF